MSWQFALTLLMALTLISRFSTAELMVIVRVPARPSRLNAAMRGNLACDQAGGLPLKKFTNLASFCTSHNY